MVRTGLKGLEKVLNFSSRLEKSLNSVKVLEKYLISLVGLEKSLKFSNLLMPYHFSEKLVRTAYVCGRSFRFAFLNFTG